MGIWNKAGELPPRLFMGRASGPTTLGINFRNFALPKTGLSSMRDRLLYACPSGVSQEDLDRQKSSITEIQIVLI